MHRAVDDVQLLGRRRAEAVDQHGHLGPLAQIELGDQLRNHLVDQLVGRDESTAPGARLAVDAGTDLHLVLGQFEVRLAHRGQDRPGQGDPDAAGSGQGVAGHPGHLGQLGTGAGDARRHRVAEEDAGDAPPLRRVLRRCGQDVVGATHRLHRDAPVGGELGGRLEVDLVAAVVAVQVQHTLAGVDRLGDRKHDLGARRGEHVADRATVGQAADHVAHEQRQVARSPAGCYGDATAVLPAGAHDRPGLAGHRGNQARMGQQQSLERLVGETLGIIHELAHVVRTVRFSWAPSADGHQAGRSSRDQCAKSYRIRRRCQRRLSVGRRPGRPATAGPTGRSSRPA